MAAEREETAASRAEGAEAEGLRRCPVTSFACSLRAWARTLQRERRAQPERARVSDIRAVPCAGIGLRRSSRSASRRLAGIAAQASSDVASQPHAAALPSAGSSRLPRHLRSAPAAPRGHPGCTGVEARAKSAAAAGGLGRVRARSRARSRARGQTVRSCRQRARCLGARAGKRRAGTELGGTTVGTAPSLDGGNCMSPESRGSEVSPSTMCAERSAERSDSEKLRGKWERSPPAWSPFRGSPESDAASRLDETARAGTMPKRREAGARRSWRAA